MCIFNNKCTAEKPHSCLATVDIMYINYIADIVDILMYQIINKYKEDKGKRMMTLEDVARHFITVVGSQKN